MKKLILIVMTGILAIVVANLGTRLYLWHTSSPLKSTPVLDGYADYVWRVWVQSGRLPQHLWIDADKNFENVPIDYEVLDPIECRFRLCKRLSVGRRLEIDYRLTATGVVRETLRTVDASHER